MKTTSTFALAALLSTTGATLNYSTVTGYFLQDVNTTNATTFDYSAQNFGLINRTYAAECASANLTQWQKFFLELARLNAVAASNVQYKLLIMGRHAEGYHNAAETYYGTPAWNCYWSLVNGNSTASWADATLTPTGIASAQKAHDFWQHEFDVQKIPSPGSFYSSPLERCLQTANITFSNLTLPHGVQFRPIIKEFLREGISEHTCDRRHNKTYIQSLWPQFTIEPGFAENDPYWNGVTTETQQAQDWRSKVVLDQIFNSDSNSFISITSHSGEISSLLRVLGHQPFSLSTGAIIPVLVRAEDFKNLPMATTSSAWTASAHCTAPPVSSISNGANGGCVCPSSAAPVNTPLITIGPFKK